ncbi:MAG: hypothetical protein JRG71_03665 [Deltaproteobacteria bacterium]|nr:hypothetical protein [Deltaproteobacteria bacterium]
MQIVAIDSIQGDMAQWAKELAAVLGVTPYEARARVNIPSGGPAVVASFADDDLAASCVKDLTGAGFDTLCLDSAELENDQNRFIVQRLNFADEGLHLWDQSGEQLTLNFSDIVLLLRGAGIINCVQCETITKKKFAVGRALATGGLMMRKKVTSTSQSVDSERQPFCHLYAQGLPAIVLRQDLLDYTALGSECKLSRGENFNWICAELRRLCGSARWDERLQTRPGVAQLLGPVFDPECDLDLAISIVAKSCLQ